MKTKEELIEIHKELHRSLDKLTACLIENNGQTLSDTSLMEFIQWSFSQTTNPSCFRE